MLTMDEARARVARGATILDRISPGWEREIDIGVLDLSTSDRCICGQLGKGDWAHPLVIGLVVDDHSGSRAQNVGVTCEDTAEYGPLQDAWIEAIAARLHPEPVAEPVEAR